MGGPLAQATDLLGRLSHGLAAGTLEPAPAQAALVQLSDCVAQLGAKLQQLRQQNAALAAARRTLAAVLEASEERYRLEASQRQQAEEALATQRTRLQALSRRVAATEEAERRRLARELHDEIAQTLTALKLPLEALLRSLARSDIVPSGLAAALRLLDELVAQVRSLSLSLRPPALDELGLIPALRGHFDRYAEQTGVRVRFTLQGPEQRWPPELETAAYRIVQEALNNAARHSGAPEVAVTLGGRECALHIVVEDPGIGFDPDAALAAGRTFGLTGMQERAQLLGGWLQLRSAPGNGTQVTAELPVEEAGYRAR